MGLLSETAKRSFNKGIRRATVPEWIVLAQWIALGLIPVILIISFFQNDVVKPVTAVSKPPANTTSSKLDIKERQFGNELVSVKNVNGKTVKVYEESINVARKAGLAIWTGKWSNVPVLGTPAATDTPYPNAKIGDLLVFAYDEDFVTFAIKLDLEGDGKFDQSFQLSVVREAGRWVYIV